MDNAGVSVGRGWRKTTWMHINIINMMCVYRVGMGTWVLYNETRRYCSVIKNISTSNNMRANQQRPPSPDPELFPPCE